MLKLSELSVVIQDKQIINQCSYEFVSGKVHVLMGPNGSGKSSLVATIMGHPFYQISSGSISWNNEEISNLSANQRCQKGIFLANQHPVEIQGLKVIHFLQETYSKSQGKSVSIKELLDYLQPFLKLVGLSEAILERSVNVGFSGGEKKRFELLQMFLINPKLVILDELDSGVDVDGLKHLANGLSWYKTNFPETTFIMITHYGHILKYFKPDLVHIMMNGQIIASGNSSLAIDIEENGYGAYAKRIK